MLACGLVLVCYLWMPAPPAPPENRQLPVNINYVYGFSAAGPQKWLPQNVYVAVMLAVLVFGIFLPTHFILGRLFGGPRRGGKSGSYGAGEPS